MLIAPMRLQQKESFSAIADLVGWVEERNPALYTPIKYVDLLGFTIILPNLPFIPCQYSH